MPWGPQTPARLQVEPADAWSEQHGVQHWLGLPPQMPAAHNLQPETQTPEQDASLVPSSSEQLGPIGREACWTGYTSRATQQRWSPRINMQVQLVLRAKMWAD